MVYIIIIIIMFGAYTRFNVANRLNSVIIVRGNFSAAPAAPRVYMERIYR